MARIRTIKPEFFRHEELYEAEKESGLPLRVAFAGLFTVADREGRFKWKPKHLKFDVLPWDDLDFENVLINLVDYGFVVKYSVEGKDYGYIPGFTAHQVINNKESKSVLPEPTNENTRIPRVNHVTLVEGKGREGKGREHIQVACAVCGIFEKHYLLPDERMSHTANWFMTIDQQVEILLKEWNPEEAVKQIEAYKRHCKETKRKLIATDFKVAATLLSANWLKLSAPEAPPKQNDFTEAEYNRKLWTDEAWRLKYDKQIKTNTAFQEHFKLSRP
jgi:hypothetical protein